MTSKGNSRKKKAEQKTEAETPEERFYSWVLNRQLTWGVIILACLTGLIELLPELSINDRPYFISLSMVYFALSLAFSYSINYLGKLFRVTHNILSANLSDQKIGGYLVALIGKHQSYLLRPWVINSASVGSFVVWCIVWISKTGFLG